MPAGRPSKFSSELGDVICSLIAEGKSLRKICELDEYPNVCTILDWVAKGDNGDERYAHFSKQYVRAMELRTEFWAEEILDIADDDTEDRLFNEDGKLCINSEFIQRSRLKIDSRKWLMGKLKPKKYGDSTQIKHADAEGNNLSLTNILASIDGNTANLPTKQGDNEDDS